MLSSESGVRGWAGGGMHTKRPCPWTQPWTSSWTWSMDYPCEPPLIFEDEFYQRSKWMLVNRLLSFSFTHPFKFFLNSVHGLGLVWCTWRSNCRSIICGSGEIVSYRCRHFFVSSHPPQTSLPMMANGNISLSANFNSLLLTDQAQIDLHITVMFTKLLRCLSNHIIWKLNAGHFALVP